MNTRMHHLTTSLDDRHFALLTLIVIAWLVFAYAGARSQRHGVPWAAPAVAAVLVTVMAAASPMLGLGAVQWVIFAVLGVMWERGRR